MNGLLIKDFKILKVQKMFYLFVIMILIGLETVIYDASLAYMSVVGSFLALSTISFDEYDNGFAFLFSLPISRKSYTAEKYVLGLIICGVSWLLAILITSIVGLFKNTFIMEDTVMTALQTLVVVLIMLAVLIPIRLKFGSEKSGVAYIGAFGVTFLIGYLIVKIAELFHIDLIAILDHLSAAGMGTIIIAAFGIAILSLLLSFRISLSIMDKKEF